MISESPSGFERRLSLYVRDVSKGVEPVLRDAATVYAQGVVAGLSLAIAALQRRERLIDYLKRWEHQARFREDRENGG
jgi:hypothetical protein